MGGYSLNASPLKENYIQKFYLSCEFNLNDFAPKEKECMSEFELNPSKSKNSTLSQFAISALSPIVDNSKKNIIISKSSKMRNSTLFDLFLKNMTNSTNSIVNDKKRKKEYF